MYAGWMLFRLEIKKFIAMLPVILAETVLTGLILLGIGFCASKAVYGEKAVDEIRVGIVTYGEDSLTEMLIGFVESMDSVKDTASFVRLSEEKAREELAAGELAAAILVPEGIVDSVNSGENIPATILLADDYSRVETEVFAQFTKTGAKLLTVAQAGIYAADALCMEEGCPERIPESEDYLNRQYLDYAMGRSGLFKEVEVSAAAGISLAEYYKISLLLAFLSFAGFSFGKSMEVQSGDREKVLMTRGMGAGKRYLIETAAFSCVFALLGTILGSLLTAAAGWLWMGLVWFTMGTFLRALFQMTGNHTGGFLLCFGILMALMLTAGVFIPTAFLPLWVEKFGQIIPYKSWMEILTAISQKSFSGKMAAELAGMIFVFLAVGCLAVAVRGREKEKKIFLRQGTPRWETPRRGGVFFKNEKKTSVWIILWKQFFLRYRLWIGVILLTAFLGGLFKERLSGQQEYQGIVVGICSSDEKSGELLSGLLEETGIIRFQEYTDEEEMLRQIKNGSLECGFSLPEGFYDRLVRGKIKRQATLFYSPASSVHKIAGEVVFAEIFKLLSKEVLDGDLRALGYEKETDFAAVRERLYALNEKYMGNGSTFHFVYETGEGDMGEAAESLSMVRGLVAVMIFLMTVLGLGNVLEREAVWSSMPGKMGKRLRMRSIHVAVAGSVLTGGAVLYLSGSMERPAKELAGLLLYFIVLEVFIMILRLFVKNSRALYGLLPVLVLCSFLFCPVFIRIGRYLPQIAWAARIFPATYYLELF